MRGRLYAAAILAGVAVMVALAVLLVIAGRFDPSPPSLRVNPRPEIPGEILYVNEEGCIIRARASGERRERVTCVGEGVGPVSWIDAATIGYATWSPGAPMWTELDLRTGSETVKNLVARPSGPDVTSVRGERIDIDRDGDVHRVTGTERVKIFDFEGPEYRQPLLATWSPDGDWVLLHYQGELWIVSRDGRVKGTLAQGRSYPNGGSWWIDGYGYLPRIDPQPVSPTPGLPPGR